MSNKKTVAERFATIENELLHIKESLKQLNENHLPHIYDQLDVIKKAVQDLKDCLKPRLTGRDKAVVYGSIATAVGGIIIALIGVFH